MATARNEGGPVSITALDASGTSGTLSYSVGAAIPAGIAIEPAQLPDGVPVGLEGNFKATYSMTDNTTSDATSDVTWASSNSGVVGVFNGADNKGKAIALQAGDSEISASKDMLQSANTVSVKVFTPTQAAAFVIEPSSPDQLPLGRTQQFRALLKYSTGETVDVTQRVVWQSSAENLARFPDDFPKGMLLASPADTGALTITAQDPASTTQAAPVSVNVANLAVNSITVSPQESFDRPLAIGASRQLGAIATYSDNVVRDITQTVNWSTAADSYLSVTNDFGTKGLVKVNRVRADGAPVESVTVSDTISGAAIGVPIDTTGRTLNRIEIAPVDKQTLPKGLKRQFNASAIFTDGTADSVTGIVTWRSSAGDKLAISNAGGNQGQATALAEGTSVVSAAVTIDGDTTASNSVVVDVTPATLQSIAINPNSAVELAVGSTKRLTAQATFTDGTALDVTSQVNWRSTDTSIVSVSSTGSAAGTIRGEMQGGPVTISAADPRSTVNASKAVSVTAIAENQISVLPDGTTTRPVGVPFEYTADLLFSDNSVQPATEQVQWSTSDPTIALISNETGSRGRIVGLAAGTVTVTARGGGLTSTPVTFAVAGSLLQSIAISPSAPQGITVGDTVQFSANASYSDGSTQDITHSVAWITDTPNVATIGRTAPSIGVLAAKNTGLATITASKDNVTSNATEVVVSASTGGTGTLSITVEAGGRVVDSNGQVLCDGGSTCDQELQIGQVLDIFAIPDSGNRFEEWEGCDAANGPSCTMTIDNPSESVKAEFDSL